MIAVFVTLFISIAQADIVVGPTIFDIYPDIAVWLEISVNNTWNNPMKAVTFTVTPDSSTVSIAYSGSASNGSFGDIASHAVGYSSFNLVAGEGVYNLHIIVAYKKLSSYFSYSTYIPLYVDDGSSGTTDEKRISVVINLPEGGVEAKGENLVDLTIGKRNADFTYQPNYYEASDSTPIWQEVDITAGSSNLHNVSFIVTADSSLVSIAYSSNPGNYIGLIDAGTSGFGSFQVSAPANVYNLNITVTYKRGGGSTYYKSSVIVPFYVDGGDTSTTDTTDEKRSIAARSVEVSKRSVEVNNAQASQGIVGFSFFVGGAVGFVAAATIGAVVAVLFVVRKNAALPSA